MYNGTHSIVFQNSSQIILKNFLTADLGLSSSFLFISGFFVTTPKSTRPYTITYTTYNYVGNITYGIDTLTVTNSCSFGAITVYSLTTTNNFVNVVNTYTITFKNIYALAVGSYIGVTFPNSLSVSSPCSSSNAGLSCTVISNNFINVSISTSISSASTIVLIFNSVTNPNQAITIPSIALATYYDSGLDSLVDQLTSGLTMTAVANLIPDGIYILPSSFTVYDNNVNYIFSLALVDKIPAGGYISVQFPTQITISGINLGSASFSTTTCVLGGPTLNRLNITSCFLTDMTTLSISFTLGGILNPNSVQTTSTFTIETYGPLGLVNYNNTMTVKMITPASISIFSLVPQVKTVNIYTIYTLGLTFSIPHSANDYFTL